MQHHFLLLGASKLSNSNEKTINKFINLSRKLLEPLKNFHKTQIKRFTLRESTLDRRATTQFLREMGVCLDAMPISRYFLKKQLTHIDNNLMMQVVH
jgi:hypothetical protein